MIIVWVFAGGGQSEIEGLLPFLRKEFPLPNYDFKRVTPVSNKDGRKPNKQNDKLKKERSPQGLTGKSLLKELQERLNHKFKLNDPMCDLILIFDDLDYPPEGINAPNEFCQLKSQEFVALLNQVWKNNPNITPVNHVIGFAKPELESWVIADWDQTLARDPKFRDKCKAMQHWLVTDRQLSFSNPEDFGLDPAFPQSYHQKLSNAIIQASEQKEGMRYSKQLHTARFIRQLDSAIAQQKCPEFRKFFTNLSRLTSPSKS
ncbi:MAG: DUF4276 family protein [Pseudanabaena sp. LacPavin_0818_WC45_MAG_42_6]|nr:DUF4276 family protein [Pseudanabaena sp. LacPavin_0818_WC45_MAG_42_6]